MSYAGNIVQLFSSSYIRTRAIVTDLGLRGFPLAFVSRSLALPESWSESSTTGLGTRWPYSPGAPGTINSSYCILGNKLSVDNPVKVFLSFTWFFSFPRTKSFNCFSAQRDNSAGVALEAIRCWDCHSTTEHDLILSQVEHSDWSRALQIMSSDWWTLY